MGSWIEFSMYLVYLQLMINSVFCDSWYYENTGEWDKKCKACAGMQQSPINIVDTKAATLAKPMQLSFNKNFSVSFDTVLTNNGKIAKLKVPANSSVTVSGDRLYVQGNFTLEEVHFHWGIRGASSEHRIDGKSASMEVQLVCRNLKYSSMKTASKMPDGILVMSSLVDVSTDVSQNSFWNDLTAKCSLIRNSGQSTSLSNVQFNNFLPRNRNDFYMYKGSFTTPPCFETAWVVFRERLLIPQEYLNRFRALMTRNSSGNLITISSNIRPVKAKDQGLF